MNQPEPLLPLDILRAQTRAAHEALHHHPLIGRLLAKDLTVGEYRAIITGYYGFYAAVEDRREVLACYPQYHLQAAVDALAEDLDQLGASPSQSTPSLAYLASPQECLAGLYVLHGARAGASMIAKQLVINHPHLPRSFFTLPRAPLMWKDLSADINRFEPMPAQQTALCQAAERVFVDFGQWL